MVQIDSAEHFFDIQKKFPHIPFSQSKAWYEYIKKRDCDIVFFADNIIDSKIALWGREEKIPLLGKKLLRIEGECYYPDLSETAFRAFYSELARSGYVGIEMNSNNLYRIEFEIGVRRGGFKRPISMFACPLSIEIDLSEEFKFNPKWKRNIKKAKEYKISFEELNRIDDKNLERIVGIFSEMAESKGMIFKLEKAPLRKLLISPGIRTFVAKNESGKTVAARILHVNNGYAMDIFTANSLESRDSGATYFLAEQTLRKLKTEGFLFFDFGRIPPSNNDMDNIYVFKNSSRGRKVQYNGEWSFYRSSLFERMVSIYKQFGIRKQRY